ncbi:MAG: hypothetical protein ACSLFQ_20525 [Thermoanaerobaculia bacterium]
MRQALTVAVALLVFAGCVTSKPTEESHVMETTIAGRNCDTPVTVYIDATTEKSVKIPASIELCKQATDLVWYAEGARAFAVSYKPEKSDPNDLAELDERDAPCGEVFDANNRVIGISCTLNRVKHRKAGRISYGIKITPKRGEPFKIDPQLIIRR